MSWSGRWAPYVPVHTKLRQAGALAKKHAKAQGRSPQPVTVSGRTIASTFWGRAWCDNLNTWKDYDNRLPRGIAYLRNGSVADLFISKLSVEAIVAGSVPYHITIKFTQLPDARWKKLRSECTASINSLLDLLAGKFSKGLMELLTSTRTGLFPAAGEMKMSCNCPDSSGCCKHLAAVFYAIGAKLDHQPELLFVLRGVDHHELVTHATSARNLDRELNAAGTSELQTDDLGQLFGIELAGSAAGPDSTFSSNSSTPAAAGKSRSKMVAAKKSAAGKVPADTASPVPSPAARPKSGRPAVPARRAKAAAPVAAGAAVASGAAGRRDTPKPSAAKGTAAAPRKAGSSKARSAATRSKTARSAPASVPSGGAAGAASNRLLNAIAETLTAKPTDAGKSKPPGSRGGKRAAK